jgi:hypothetical protein
MASIHRDRHYPCATEKDLNFIAEDNKYKCAFYQPPEEA